MIVDTVFSCAASFIQVKAADIFLLRWNKIMVERTVWSL